MYVNKGTENDEAERGKTEEHTIPAKNKLFDIIAIKK